MIDPLLMINYEYPPIGAGASNATFHIAESLVQRGRTVHVVTARFGRLCGQAVEGGVHVHRIRSLRNKKEQSSLVEMLIFVLSSLWHLPGIIKSVRPRSCIIFFGFPCGPLGLYIQLFHRVPYVISLRGGDVPGTENKLAFLHRLLSPLRRLVYINSKAVVANSTGLKNLSLKSDPQTGITVIPNGVATDFYSPTLLPPPAGAPYTFLFAGRFNAQKNIALLLQACRICLDRDTRLHLQLAGGGPLNDVLRTQAGTLGINPVLTWIDWCTREHLLMLYRGADCFINPSVYEGMSNTVLEAMSCGLPVLAGDCIGNNELLTNGKNGFLFNPSSSNDLAALMEYMATHREEGRTMGRYARELCVKYYSWESAAAGYERCIEGS